MNVALVCPYDLTAPGGVQHVVGELARRLPAYGDEARIVAVGTSLPGGAVGVGKASTVRANGSTVPLTLAPASIPRVRAAVSGAEVVHVHEPLVPLVGWAALSARLPTVATFHAAPAAWTTAAYRLFAPLGRRALDDAVLSAVSPVAAAAIPSSWGPVAVVPNGIDVAAYNPSCDRLVDRVVFVGRDDPRKGLDVALAAWPSVRSAHPEASLVVIGAERPARIPPTQIPGVSFVGRVDEETKRRLLETSAVFVAPNLGGESFGIVLLEAMAAGCAVVASDLPAFREVLGGVGELVPPADPDRLARAVVATLDSRLAERAKAARVRAESFAWEEVVPSYRRLYEEALNRAGSARR